MKTFLDSAGVLCTEPDAVDTSDGTGTRMDGTTERVVKVLFTYDGGRKIAFLLGLHDAEVIGKNILAAARPDA